MNKITCLFSLAISLVIASVSYGKHMDQTCYDGINSKAIISVENGIYSVELSGPVVETLVSKGLVYSSQLIPQTVVFSSPLVFNQHGTSIVQSGQFLTYRASWDLGALVILASGGMQSKTQSWILQNCQK